MLGADDAGKYRYGSRLARLLEIQVQVVVFSEGQRGTKAVSRPIAYPAGFFFVTCPGNITFETSEADSSLNQRGGTLMKVDADHVFPSARSGHN